MINDSRLRNPIMLISGCHIQSRLHTAAYRCTRIRSQLATSPKPISQSASPEQLVMATTLERLLLETHIREITLETSPEMICEMKLRTTAQTEGHTLRIVTIRIVAPEHISGVSHHTARKPLDELLLLLCTADKNACQQHNNK